MNSILNNKLLLKYFAPKRFEHYRRGSIYTWFGVKIFKKFVPTTGDLARKWKGIQQIKMNQQDRFSELLKYELKTRSFELRHWLGMIVFIVLLFVIQKHYSIFDYVFVTVMFLVVNIYPILLQRHNRIRILNVLKRYEQTSPYDS